MAKKTTTDTALADDGSKITWDHDGNAPARKARLAPAELVPTATITTANGEFAVRVRTGRQGETLSPMDACDRATALEQSAEAIRKIASKVRRVNATDDEDAA